MPAVDDATGDAPSLSVLSWLALSVLRDEDLAESAARRALAVDSGCRFAAAAMAEIHLRRAEYDEAIDLLRTARAAHPESPWYSLTLSDALLEAKRYDEAAWVLEEAARGRLERHALKRLARIGLERGRIDDAIKWQSRLVGMAPNYLVYASDYLLLARLHDDNGDRESAGDVLMAGARMYPRNAMIRQSLRSMGTPAEVIPSAPPVRSAIDEGEMGVRRVPVVTPLITGRVDLASVIDAATAGIRHPGDVIALSESAAAAGQGRAVPLELISPGLPAKVLCRFVGAIGPLHSPEGMQGAILDRGSFRVLAGAAAGAAGKLVRKRGWFYRVAGRSTAMIDDVAACLPPLDHHVIFGPANPDSLATALAARLSCGVAIVDANHLTGAWVVGASPGIDRGWVEAALSDNPAGNEDEQTPVVLIQRAGP